MTGFLAASAATKVLGLFSGALGYVAVAAASASAATWITAQHYQARLALAETSRAQDAADRARATLAQFVTDSAAIHDAAAIFTQQQQSFKEGLASINASFDSLARSAPLPASCKPDAKRLRNLEDALDAANRAIATAGTKPGAAMPTDRSTKPH